MRKLILVRPGATEYDQQGRIQGTLDIPLCEDGRRQSAQTLAEVQAANPEAVYSAPCESARETAEAIAAGCEVKAKTVDKLHNLDHGLWQGMLVEEVRAKQPKVYRQWREQPETVCPPEGESILSAKQRVAEALEKLLRKHRDTERPIAIVAPEPLASVIRHVIRQEPLSDLWKTADLCGAWEELDLPEEMAVGA